MRNRRSISLTIGIRGGSKENEEGIIFCFHNIYVAMQFIFMGRGSAR